MRTGASRRCAAWTGPSAVAERFRFARPGDAPTPITLAQIDGFGFGGINAVAVVEAPLAGASTAVTA